MTISLERRKAFENIGIYFRKSALLTGVPGFLCLLLLGRAEEASCLSPVSRGKNKPAKAARGDQGFSPSCTAVIQKSQV